MGQISFWGVQHGLGVTSNTAALAAMIGMDYQIRTLVSQPQWSDTTLERTFNKSINQYNKNILDASGTGLDALERLARSNKLERESIKNNTLLVERDRLDLLSGTEKANKLHFENSDDVMKMIYDKAKEYYDAILLDVHSGNNSPIIQKMLSNSEMIVVCLNQNINVLDKFFDEDNWPEALKEKPRLVIIGQYDANSKYKVKNIAKKYNYKGPILTIPYNTSFKDAFNDGDVKGFLYRNRYVTKSHENYIFMNAVRNIAKTILTEIGVNTQVKHIERGAS